MPPCLLATFQFGLGTSSLEQSSEVSPNCSLSAPVSPYSGTGPDTVSAFCRISPIARVEGCHLPHTLPRKAGAVLGLEVSQV